LKLNRQVFKQNEVVLETYLVAQKQLNNKGEMSKVVFFEKLEEFKMGISMEHLEYLMTIWFMNFNKCLTVNFATLVEFVRNFALKLSK